MSKQESFDEYFSHREEETSILDKSNEKSQTCSSMVESPGACEVDYFTFDILKVSCDDVANQMTLIDGTNFSKIEPNEFTSCSWTNREKNIFAPNIVVFTKQFNQYSFMVQDEILKYSVLKERCEVIVHFIKVAKRLYELNNFSGLAAIISAFQSNSIYRLKQTWDSLPRREYTVFIKLSSLISEQNNWDNYRNLEKTSKLPIIPYIVIYLTDLMYVNLAYPKSTIFQSHHRNDHMGNIIRRISEFQKSDYGIKAIPYLQKYLSQVRYIEETQLFIEDDYFKTSLNLEPNDQENPTTSTPRKITGNKHVRGSSLGSSKYFASRMSAPINHKANASFCMATPERNLIDDSAIMESPYFSCYMRDESIGEISRTSSIRKGQLNIDYSKLNYVIENYVKRRTIFKKSKRTMVHGWSRFYGAVYESCLIFFNSRRISGFSRKINKSKPCKVYNIIDWTIVLCYNNDKATDCVKITNPQKGDMYQLKFASIEMATEWYSVLVKASKLHIKRLPDNLINFDDTSTESKSSSNTEFGENLVSTKSLKGDVNLYKKIDKQVDEKKHTREEHVNLPSHFSRVSVKVSDTQLKNSIDVDLVERFGRLSAK